MPSSQYLSLAYINSKKEFAPIGHEEDFCKRIDDEKQNIKNDFFSFYPELWNKIYDIKENIEKFDYRWEDVKNMVQNPKRGDETEDFRNGMEQEKHEINEFANDLYLDANFMNKKNLYDSVFPLKNCKYSQYTPFQLRKMYIVKQLCKKYVWAYEEDVIKVIDFHNAVAGRYISVGKTKKRGDYPFKDFQDGDIYYEFVIGDLYCILSRYEYTRENEPLPAVACNDPSELEDFRCYGNKFVF